MAVELSIGPQKYEFESDSVGIGRAASNHISLPDDERLEQRHAILRHAGGRWIIESCEGGPVCIGDGRPVRVALLNSGDVIRLTESGPDILFKLPVSKASIPAIPATKQPEPLPLGSAAASKTLRPAVRADGRVSDDALVQSDESFHSASPGRMLVPVVTVVLAVIATSAVGIAIWAPGGKSNEHRQLAAPPPQSEPIATAQDSASGSSTDPVDPKDFLVLVGIGDLQTDNRPHIMGVGWLWNDKTVVIPRTLGDALSELVEATKTKGTPRQACVIQGVAMEVKEILPLSDCPKVSILRLSESAELSTPVRDVWRRVTATDIERLRQHGKSLSYVSYAPLPRSPNISGSHGFSLQPYDPELVRMQTEEAKLLYEQRIHLLKAADPAARLERGGLLVDQAQKIVGMTALDSTVIWTDSLEQSLGKP